MATAASRVALVAWTAAAADVAGAAEAAAMLAVGAMVVGATGLGADEAAFTVLAFAASVAAGGTWAVGARLDPSFDGGVLVEEAVTAAVFATSPADGDESATARDEVGATVSM